MKMKSGFTMIELIFVIVIIGILSAVALPKFVGAGTQAHVANLKQLVGSINRTVMPTAWSKVVAKGGSLKDLPANETQLSVYTQIPDEINSVAGTADTNKGDGSKTDLQKTVGDNKVDITVNGTDCHGGTTWEKILDDQENQIETKAIGDNIYTIAVCDGDSTSSSKTILVKKAKTDTTNDNWVKAE